MMMRVARHRHGLPGGAVGAPSLEGFGVRLDVALCNLL